MDIIDALKIIIARSPRAAETAVRTIEAARHNSPVLQTRYANVLIMALADPEATFSPAERATLATAIEAPETNSREFMLRVRLTEQDRAELQQLSEQDGIGMSEYVRRKLFG